eukprot:jgi/Bigna1/135094/aug1.28_g9802
MLFYHPLSLELRTPPPRQRWKTPGCKAQSKRLFREAVEVRVCLAYTYRSRSHGWRGGEGGYLGSFRSLSRIHKFLSEKERKFPAFRHRDFNPEMPTDDTGAPVEEYQKHGYFVARMGFVALLFGLGLLPLAANAAELDLPFPLACRFGGSCGVQNPSAKFQRYRRADYNRTSTFYQWYYFYIQERGGASDGSSLALAYSLSLTGGDENEGAYVYMGRVPKNPTDELSFFVAEKYPPEAWQLSEDEDGAIELKISYDGDGERSSAPSSSPSSFSLSIDATGDNIRLIGKMADFKRRWKTPGWVNVTLDWDFTDAIEKMNDFSKQGGEKIVGIIQWNTHSHCSRVTGEAKIQQPQGTISGGGSKEPIVFFSNDDPMSTKHRAYGDMNWGEHFPVGPKGSNDPKTYNWGWYYVGVASEDPAQELSFIAGVGTVFTGGLLGTGAGRFADFRFGANESVDMIRVGATIKHAEPRIFWDGSSDNGKNNKGGGILAFDVERSQWSNFTDSMGSAMIPMRQILTARTEKHLVVMDFRSTMANYKRLVFPTRGMFFSDFEALGVEVHVTISRDGGKSNQTFVAYNGGLEFGYKV